jgi:hypothetical protein
LSEIRANTVSDAAGTGPATLTGQSAAKAWVSIDHAPFGLFDSFNISSSSDLGTGQYQVSFANSFDNSRYACAGAAYSTPGHIINFAAEATGSTQLRSYTTAAADVDCMAMMNGDLA